MDFPRSRTALVALHALVIGAIPLQWLSSELMAKPWSDEQSGLGRLLFSVHYWSGITSSAAVVALVTVLWLRHRRPFAHFFPWARRQGRQHLLAELRQIPGPLSRLTLPPAEHTRQVAAAVQGIGLTLMTGLVSTGVLIAVVGPETGLAHEIGEVHEVFFGPLLAYLAVHGGAAILHRRAGHPLFADATSD